MDPLLARLISRTCPLPPGARVVDYSRDSGGDEQDRSVDQQQSVYDGYEKRFGLARVGRFEDRARSGGSVVGRDGLERMMAALRYRKGETRPADGVLLWKINRFGRNARESQFYLAELHILGYIPIFIADDIPDAGELTIVFETILQWKAERDRKDISTDARRGLADLVGMKKSDGSYEGFCPGRPATGFIGERVQIGTKRNGTPRIVQRWAPDPRRWDACRRAWELRAAGVGLDEIDVKLHLFNSRAGYTTFFRNRIYRGTLVYAGVVLDGFVPALIDEGTWQAVQTLNEARKRRGGLHEPRRLGDRTHMLTGLVYCRLCGRRLESFRSPSGGRMLNYYVCPGHRAKTCDARSIRADAIEPAVVADVLDTYLSDERLTEYAEAWQVDRARRGTDTDDAVRTLAGELDSAERGIKNIVRSAEQAPLSAALASRLQELERDRERKRHEMESLRAVAKDELTIDDLRAWADEMRSRLQARPADVRHTLEAIITRIDADRAGATVHYVVALGKAGGARTGRRLREHCETGSAPTGMQSVSQITLSHPERATPPSPLAERNRLLVADHETLSLRELAEKYRISATRVCQILGKQKAPQ